MTTIEVAAGLIFRRGKLLIAQRLAGVHLAGLWEFPGGKREAHETFEACLRRELLEELGIEVVVGPLIQSLTHEYPEKKIHLKFYRCVVERGDPKPIGCADAKWITQAELTRFDFPAADEKLLQLLGERADLWQDQTLP
jgi:mutator protein MutT